MLPSERTFEDIQALIRKKEQALAEASAAKDKPGILAAHKALKQLKQQSHKAATKKLKELEQKPKPGQNDRSNKHLGVEDFDQEIHQKYLNHIDINNLRGLKIELIYNWKLGETLIMDRSHIHCSSSRIKDKKLGLTTFTKK